jgi:hypothetical protein
MGQDSLHRDRCRGGHWVCIAAAGADRQPHRPASAASCAAYPSGTASAGGCEAGATTRGAGADCTDPKRCD